jgi:hypothetical protein
MNIEMELMDRVINIQQDKFDSFKKEEEEAYKSICQVTNDSIQLRKNNDNINNKLKRESSYLTDNEADNDFIENELIPNDLDCDNYESKESNFSMNDISISSLTLSTSSYCSEPSTAATNEVEPILNSLIDKLCSSNNQQIVYDSVDNNKSREEGKSKFLFLFY